MVAGRLTPVGPRSAQPLPVVDAVVRPVPVSGLTPDTLRAGVGLPPELGLITDLFRKSFEGPREEVNRAIHQLLRKLSQSGKADGGFGPVELAIPTVMRRDRLARTDGPCAVREVVSSPMCHLGSGQQPRQLITLFRCHLIMDFTESADCLQQVGRRLTCNDDRGILRTDQSRRQRSQVGFKIGSVLDNSPEGLCKQPGRVALWTVFSQMARFSGIGSPDQGTSVTSPRARNTAPRLLGRRGGSECPNTTDDDCSGALSTLRARRSRERASEPQRFLRNKREGLGTPQRGHGLGAESKAPYCANVLFDTHSGAPELG